NDKKLPKYYATRSFEGCETSEYYLGLCYQKLGNLPAARTKLGRALQLTGGNFPEAQKVLGGLPTTNN
ncbi:MAG: hypothetical protein ACYC3E_00970, partial [Carboxydocellales bacterium]